MTRTLATFDTDNDLVRGGDGSIVVLTGLAAVAANCRTAVQAQRGEMMFALDTGMPTAATAWNRLNPAQFEAAARLVLLSVADVLAVEAFSMRRVDEVLGYTATIRTSFGVAQVNG